MITIKEIIPYLPYGLKVFHEKKGKIHNVIGIYSYSNEFIWCFIDYGDPIFKDNEYYQFKPILHPLSDLTKEIEVNEGKFVPILELAKIYEGSIFGQYKTTIENNIAAIKYSDGDCFFIVFAYHFNTQCFGSHTIEDNSFHVVTNQLQLFQKLFEWHFDVFGLIERGDAIDINILNI